MAFALAMVAAGVEKGKLNILCVCAHPDDAELNCGGTLLKYHKQGHNIFIVLTTSGNTGSNVMTDIKEIERVREAETLASAKLYDAQVRFLRADDERLLDSNEMRTKVLDAMRWANLHESQKAWLRLYKGPKDLSAAKRIAAAFWGFQYGCAAAEGL